MCDKYLFEIILYRISEELFSQEYDQDLSSYLQTAISAKIPAEKLDIYEDIFRAKYGAPWNYNQLIGAIQIYFSGNQIRGELWISNRKRYLRIMKNKQIVSFGSIFDFTIYEDMKNNEINKLVKTNINGYLQRDKRVFADMTFFNNICEYIDWIQMLRDSKK